MTARASQVDRLFRWAAGAVYVGAGVGLVALGAPVALLPFHWEGLGRWVAWVLMALPVWLGLASIPGVVFAMILIGREQEDCPSWVRFSLWAALLAATAGTAGGSMMALFIPFGITVMVGSVVLLCIFEGLEKRNAVWWWAKVFGVVSVVFAATLWALQVPHGGGPG